MKSSPTQWFYSVTITLFFLLTLAAVGGAFGGGGTPNYGTVELFRPADYAFSIWSVIYMGLFGLGIWLGLPTQRDNERALAAAPWLLFSALSNFLWALAAGSRETVVWTLPAIILMGITAWIAYFKFRVGAKDLPLLEQLLHLPLRIYVGWLSVATIANVAAVLNGLIWDGWGIDPVTWTVIILLVGTPIHIVVIG